MNRRKINRKWHVAKRSEENIVINGESISKLAIIESGMANNQWLA